MTTVPPPSEGQWWERLKKIVTRALELAPEERGPYLDQDCAGDEEMRREAASLLRFEGAPEIESPVPAAGPPLAPGDLLGAWCVLEMLASGGMGEVYLGERADGHFESNVAIKVIGARIVLSELLERFLSERQLLAELDHPGIARLIDGGCTEDGRPYLVMEHVDGEPIGRYCDLHGLSVEERLRLFLEVCEVVQHAHRHLVVHRDLKPANIMVTAGGTPKLLDFGVAKDLGAGGKTPDTRLLVPVTVEYASPEQLTGGAVTTAVDVYSLGVVLYELLAGGNPFRGDDPLKGRTRSASVAPPSAQLGRGAEARRQRRQLTGDLDHIVLKALDPDPAKRYPSVKQLAREIGQHLGGLPLETRPGALYRLGKGLRRHWKALIAMVVTLALAAGLVEERLERRHLEVQRAQLERENQRIGELSGGLSGYLIRILRTADPALAGERIPTLERLLDRGAELLARGGFADQPLARAFPPRRHRPDLPAPGLAGESGASVAREPGLAPRVDAAGSPADRLRL